MTLSKMRMGLLTVPLQALLNVLLRKEWRLHWEKKQENRRRKVTGDVEAQICAIACSTPSTPLEEASR